MGKKQEKPVLLPMLKTPELMSRVCGIGENRLRALMDAGELEYLPIGNRRLLCDDAIWAYYQRKKVQATTAS